MIHWLRTIDYCFWFSFLTTYLCKFLQKIFFHFLDNDDRTSSKRRNLSALVFLINTKLNHLFFLDDLKLYARNENQLDSLIQTVRIVSKDIGMKFGIEKCAVLVLRRGRLAQSEGIRLPDETTIRAIREIEGYKYLGVLEADGMLHDTMKKKIAEYLRRVRKVAQSKLNGGNLKYVP